jgi:hypothetical protein
MLWGATEYQYRLADPYSLQPARIAYDQAMTLNRFLLSLVLALFLVAPSRAFGAAILIPGDVLEVRFSVTNPICPGGPCDVFLTFPSAEGAFNVVPNGGALFDGSTLLGFHSGTYDPNFRAASSLFTTLNSATVDFSSINDGSIQGLITFSIASGYMTWNGEPGMFLTLGHASGSGFVSGGTGLTITSSTIVAPEPASALLCAVSIGLLQFMRGREKRKRN